MPKLTKAAIEKTAPPDRGEIVLRDDEVKGLHVRISSAGKRTFSLYYRTLHGRERRMKLGYVGEIPLPQVRDIARQNLLDVRRGNDPAGNRAGGKAAPTIADLHQRYMREHAQPHKKEKSRINDDSIWKNHILPSIGRHKVDSVTLDDITDLHIRVTKVAKTQGNRVIALLSKAFNLAEKWNWRPKGSNPCRHVTRNKEQRRHRFLSPDEVNRLIACLVNDAQSKIYARQRVAVLILLLLLTGARLREIMFAKWSWIEGDILRLPDSKTGSKDIILPAEAIKIMGWWRDLTNSIYIIPGDKPNKPLSSPKSRWKSIKAEAGINDIRIHDLRRTFASVALSNGTTLDGVGDLLGHASAQTTKGYAFLMEDPKRKAVNAAAARMLQPS